MSTSMKLSTRPQPRQDENNSTSRNISQNFPGYSDSLPKYAEILINTEKVGEPLADSKWKLEEDIPASPINNDNNQNTSNNGQLSAHPRLSISKSCEDLISTGASTNNKLLVSYPSIPRIRAQSELPSNINNSDNTNEGLKSKVHLKAKLKGGTMMDKFFKRWIPTCQKLDIIPVSTPEEGPITNNNFNVFVPNPTFCETLIINEPSLTLSNYYHHNSFSKAKNAWFHSQISLDTQSHRLLVVVIKSGKLFTFNLAHANMAWRGVNVGTGRPYVIKLSLVSGKDLILSFTENKDFEIWRICIKHEISK
jgi:hypothetical protein